MGIDVASARAFSLARTLREGIASIPGARVLDGGKQQCAIVTATFEGCDAREVVKGLKARKINATSSLKWYGLLDFPAKGVEAAVRLSPHYYNTEEEVDAALDALKSISS